MSRLVSKEQLLEVQSEIYCDDMVSCAPTIPRASHVFAALPLGYTHPSPYMPESHLRMLAATPRETCVAGSRGWRYAWCCLVLPGAAARRYRRTSSPTSSDLVSSSCAP